MQLWMGSSGHALANWYGCSWFLDGELCPVRLGHTTHLYPLAWAEPFELSSEQPLGKVEAIHHTVFMRAYGGTSSVLISYMLRQTLLLDGTPLEWEQGSRVARAARRLIPPDRG